MSYECDPVKPRSDLSLKKWIYPNGINVAGSNSVFKGGDRSELEKCRPISICVSNMLERIMYNQVHKCLLENFFEQLGFQVGHSTDHAIIQHVNQTVQAFDNNILAVDVFIDLWYSIVYHITLLKKIELYIIKGNGLC